MKERIHMRDSGLWNFVFGMIAVVFIVALMALAGPRVIPNQLDKCWVELQRNMPNCSIKTIGTTTYVRDSRCVKAEEGIIMASTGDKGWFKLERRAPAPEVKPKP